ncbi:hypothetical protein GCM10022236_41960 [Microlunatus ginsengisoli]|uniref:NIL domain-containing protein n=2 Tax=Microlunatus ginsengisoli TaxID=363863 RepID=A0ABP7AKN2_9ACTN
MIVARRRGSAVSDQSEDLPWRGNPTVTIANDRTVRTRHLWGMALSSSVGSVSGTRIAHIVLRGAFTVDMADALAQDEVEDSCGEVHVRARIGEPAAVCVLLDQVRSLGATLDYLCVEA